MTKISGCKLLPLDDSICRKWLGWLRGGTAPEGSSTDTAWLLAHCDDGVTWGRFENGRWKLAADTYPEICPVPKESNLLELRIFSSAAETLCWRTDGQFHGRVVRDTPVHAIEDALRPYEEHRILLGDRVLAQAGDFTHVGDGTGAEQVLPVRLDLQSVPAQYRPTLLVRHYFSQDEATGAVRVSLSRLVDIYWRSR